MEDPNLSYLIGTRNRLPVLRVVLPRLIEHRREDEEIVVVDGGSTDGAVEYLADLLKTGLIQQFISKPDLGQAHCYNRGLLTARGRLIKIINDDDAFYWPGVDACKRFMLDHEEIDILGSNGGGTNWTRSDCFMPFDYGDAYLRWRDDHTCFEFCDLGLMIRRASLPLLGLFNPAFVRVDMEYTLRVTQGPAKLAWHLGYDYMRISHGQSSAVTRSARLADEACYEAAHAGVQGVRPRALKTPASLSYYRRLRSASGRLRRRLLPFVGKASQSVSKMPDTSQGADEWLEIFENAEKWLADKNAQPGEFLL